MPITVNAKKALQKRREKAKMSKAEFKLALMEAGYLSDVKDFVANTSDERIQILWEDSGNFARLNDDLLRLATEMGYTEADLDDIFGIGA